MVTATRVRSLILESAINPAKDPLWAGVVALGNTDYFALRAIELTQQARSAKTVEDKNDLMKQAVTLLALARSSLDGDAKPSKK